MKLVTGIEAIQSGKPWRYHTRTDIWFINDVPLNYICGNDLLIKQFVIKEEPREFWILPGVIKSQTVTETRKDDPVDKFEKEGWIRVREVEK